MPPGPGSTVQATDGRRAERSKGNGCRYRVRFAPARLASITRKYPDTRRGAPAHIGTNALPGLGDARRLSAMGSGGAAAGPATITSRVAHQYC